MVSARTDIPLQVPGKPARSGRQRVQEWLSRPMVMRLLSVAVVLGLWQLIGANQPYSTSSPSAIVSAAADTLSSDVLPAFGDTLGGLGVGYGIAVLIGIPV